jgi:CheY-like chemotaxis protein
MISTPSGCQIVLAEDNPADVGLVRHVLRAHAIDCDLRVISDGEEVLSFITGLDLNTTMRCPDLLLLDLHLPKRDGKEVLEHLRTSERCRQTPVVIFTSSDQGADCSIAGWAPALRYFRKPVSLAQFMRLGIVIKEVIAMRHPVSRVAPASTEYMTKY